MNVDDKTFDKMLDATVDALIHDSGEVRYELHHGRIIERRQRIALIAALKIIPEPIQLVEAVLIIHRLREALAFVRNHQKVLDAIAESDALIAKIGVETYEPERT